MSDRLPGQWDGLEDGFHDAPMEDYLSWPLISASALGTLRERTPSYLKWSLHNEDTDDDSASSSLGTLTHTAILEPDLLETEFVPEPEPDPEKFPTASGKPSSNPRATKAFKERVAELEASGKRVVTREAWDAAKAMRDAVFAHKRAKQLMHADGPVEQSGIVVDASTGVRCKIRPDKLIPKIGAHVNVKTTKNAERGEFARDVYYMGYYVSMAFYARLLPALGFDHRSPILLAVETSGPNLVSVYELDAGAMDAGEQMVDMLMTRIARCFENDDWPGHPDEITSLTLPHWAWARVDEELMDHGF